MTILNQLKIRKILIYILLAEIYIVGGLFVIILIGYTGAKANIP